MFLSILLAAGAATTAAGASAVAVATSSPTIMSMLLELSPWFGLLYLIVKDYRNNSKQELKEMKDDNKSLADVVKKLSSEVNNHTLLHQANQTERERLVDHNNERLSHLEQRVSLVDQVLSKVQAVEIRMEAQNNQIAELKSDIKEFKADMKQFNAELMSLLKSIKST